MAHASTCTGTRADGSPCTSGIVLPSGYCFAHDPDRAAARRAASAEGGRNKSRIARVERLVPASLKPTIALLFTALEETHAGELDPKAASAMAALAGATGRLYAAGQFEERIAALEERAAGGGYVR